MEREASELKLIIQSQKLEISSLTDQKTITHSSFSEISILRSQNIQFKAEVTDLHYEIDQKIT